MLKANTEITLILGTVRMKSETVTHGGLEFKLQRRKGGHPGGSCSIMGRTLHGKFWKPESILAKTFMGQLQVAADWKGQGALGDLGFSVPLSLPTALTGILVVAS